MTDSFSNEVEKNIRNEQTVLDYVREGSFSIVSNAWMFDEISIDKIQSIDMDSDTGKYFFTIETSVGKFKIMIDRE